MMPIVGAAATAGKLANKADNATDIILTRFGKPRESVEKLAGEAAKAEEKIGIHGVSVTSAPKFPGPSAPKSVVEQSFPVRKTLGPNHYTVLLPKPVTQDVADRFNDIFRCKQ